MIVNLIAILTLCPVFCGTEEADHGTHWHGTSAGNDSDELPASPGHCPEDGDNCICQGAIQSAAVRVSDAFVVALSSPLVFALATPPHPLAHLTCEGAPTGLAGWGNSHAVRAFLQNFRC